MSEEGEKVTLHLYDLSNGMARQFSPMFIGQTIEGIWHTGIVVYGREYFFGGGICHDVPARTPYGTPVERIHLGHTHIPKEMFHHEFLNEIRPRYTIATYNILNNNCNNFSNECSEFLVGRPIPSHITGLPDTLINTPIGQMVRPFLEQMQNQMTSHMGELSIDGSGGNGNHPWAGQNNPFGGGGMPGGLGGLASMMGGMGGAPAPAPVPYSQANSTPFQFPGANNAPAPAPANANPRPESAPAAPATGQPTSTAPARVPAEEQLSARKPRVLNADTKTSLEYLESNKSAIGLTDADLANIKGAVQVLTSGKAGDKISEDACVTLARAVKDSGDAHMKPLLSMMASVLGREEAAEYFIKHNESLVHLLNRVSTRPAHDDAVSLATLRVAANTYATNAGAKLMTSRAVVSSVISATKHALRSQDDRMRQMASILLYNATALHASAAQQVGDDDDIMAQLMGLAAGTIQNETNLLALDTCILAVGFLLKQCDRAKKVATSLPAMNKIKNMRGSSDKNIADACTAVTKLLK